MHGEEQLEVAADWFEMNFQDESLTLVGFSPIFSLLAKPPTFPLFLFLNPDPSIYIFSPSPLILPSYLNIPNFFHSFIPSSTWLSLSSVFLISPHSYSLHLHVCLTTFSIWHFLPPWWPNCASCVANLSLFLLGDNPLLVFLILFISFVFPVLFNLSTTLSFFLSSPLPFIY